VCHSARRYSKGQRFGKHIDESVELPGGRFTGFTLLVYLSSCSGGETIFYGEHVAVGLSLGAGVDMESMLEGQACEVRGPFSVDSDFKQRFAGCLLPSSLF
jgi:hypothetical protein